MYCHQCGKEVADGNFCPYCGASLTNNQGYQSLNQNDQQDESSIGFAFLSFFIPIVGLILFLVWNKDFPLKAKSCLKGFISGIILYVVIVCCVVASVFGAISHSDHYDPYEEYHYDFNSIVEVIPYDTIDSFVNK